MRIWWLTALALGMVGSAIAQSEIPETGPTRVAQADSVLVTFTHFGSFSEGAVRLDDDVYAPPTLLRQWGWDVTTRYADADIQLDDRTARVKMIFHKGRPLVSLTEAVKMAGARSSWKGNSNHYVVLSWIRNIEATPKGVRIDGTLPFKTKSFRLTNPDRLVLDLEGAEHDPTLLGQLPQGWRVGQVNETTVRLVIEHPAMATQPLPTVNPGRSLQLDLRSLDASIPPAPVTQPAPVKPTPGPAPTKNAAILSGFQLSSTNADSLLFAIPITKGIPGRPTGTYRSLNDLRITIPNARMDQAFDPAVSSPLIKSLKLVQVNASTVELQVNSTRGLAFSSEVRADTLSIRVYIPTFVKDGIAGKVIVVDAGHGGNDPGANHGGANEKTITLRVSNFLAEELTKLGATVIRTRTEDKFISLGDRSRIANEANADLFISIHVNSNSVANTATGSKTFYHKTESQGLLLSTAIENEFKALGKLRSMGTWSDQRIYQSGFAVLRNTRMPGVLVETGFINNSKDRGVLITEAYQRQMAKAIAQALVKLATEGS